MMGTHSVCDSLAQTTNETLGIAISLGAILLIVLILILAGALPTWGHSRTWGYAPSGGIGLIVLNRVQFETHRFRVG